jgi:hypothetical protein
VQGSEELQPIGFLNIGYPVNSMSWSPPHYIKKALVVACSRGVVVEVILPKDALMKHVDQKVSFQMKNIEANGFHFRSIRSRLDYEIYLTERQMRIDARKQLVQGRSHDEKGRNE